MISEPSDNYIISNDNNKIKISENFEQEENLIKFNKQYKILTQNGDNKRAKFQANEQKAIIDVYDKYADKAIAMRILKNIPGLENMYERKIKRWKCSTKTMGKPVSQEFEDEVYEEYLKLSKDNSNDVISFTNVSTVNLKQCGIQVLHREYWDITTNQMIKKWHTNPHTTALQFTNKWVSGFIRRRRMKLELSSSPNTSAQFLNKTFSSSTDNTSLIENLYILDVNSYDSNEDTSHVTHTSDVNQNYHDPHQRSHLQQLSTDILPIIPPTQYSHQSHFPAHSQQHDPQHQCPDLSINPLDAIIENLYHEDIIVNDDNTYVPAFDDLDLSFIEFD
jgi:hypothetical protein